MRTQESIMSKAGNEKYRNEYDRIFNSKSQIEVERKYSHVLTFTTEELTTNIPKGDGDCSGGRFSRD
jgi:hypothetical protein